MAGSAGRARTGRRTVGPGELSRSAGSSMASSASIGSCSRPLPSRARTTLALLAAAMSAGSAQMPDRSTCGRPSARPVPDATAARVSASVAGRVGRGSGVRYRPSGPDRARRGQSQPAAADGGGVRGAVGPGTWTTVGGARRDGCPTRTARDRGRRLIEKGLPQAWEAGRFPLRGVRGATRYMRTRLWLDVRQAARAPRGGSAVVTSIDVKGGCRDKFVGPTAPPKPCSGWPARGQVRRRGV
jgi:hypothetical protein